MIDFGTLWLVARVSLLALTAYLLFRGFRDGFLED